MITTNRIAGSIGTVGVVIVIDTVESMEDFKELVHRATNLWPDASAEIKEFADMITNDGVMMQDYQSFVHKRMKNVPTLTEIVKESK